MFSLKRTALLAAAFLLSSLSGFGATVFWTGPTDGDTGNMTITFPGIQVYGLESIDPGLNGAHYHNHGTLSVVFTLDLELDGVWQTISTLTAPDDLDHPITDFAPATFSGILTGISFTDTPIVSNGFHAFSNTTSFTFSDTPSDGVPEPGTVGLMATGAGALLLGRRRATRLATRP